MKFGDAEAQAYRPLKQESDLEVALLPSRDAGPSGSRVTARIATLLAIFCMIWGTVVQSEASQALQQREQFNKPFFITCFNHTFSSILLPLVVFVVKLPAPALAGPPLSWMDSMYKRSVLPKSTLLRIALLTSIVSLVADYFWYTALSGVSVTAANAIGNCSPLFVYCLSICFLGERVTFHKVAGVVLACVGVMFIIMYQDATKNFDPSTLTLQDSSVVAGILVVVSSIFYAGYQVAFKVILGADLTDTATVLIVIGLASVMTIPMWAVGSVLVAHSPYASFQEPFGLPTTTEGVVLLFASGALSVLVNTSMPLLLAWTTPLETSVAAMLVVPLAGVWDVIFHHTHFSSECIFGSVLVLAGFGVLEYVPASERAANASARTGGQSPPADEAATFLKPQAAADSVFIPWRV